MNIKNNLIIISGGASGLGEAAAKQLSEAGAIVGILDTNINQAEKLASSINGVARQCDVSSSAQVEQSISEIINFTNYPLRVAMNCAGIAPAKRMMNSDAAFFQQVMNINLVGTYNVMRVASHIMSTLEPLDNGERGVIINTASIAAFEGQIGQIAYSASKGGVVAMTLPAARELARFGVRVMCIAPGLFKTALLETISDKVKQALETQVPFPARLGGSHEFASLARHIIENDYLNGEVIRLDGALRMG